MPLQKKFLTIVIPVHNNASTIRRTILSIISNQEYIKEIIIVDDRDAQGTSGIAKELLSKNVKDVKVLYLVTEGNPGPGPARKTGLRHATGEWITFIDADDCFTMDGFKYIYRSINEYKESDDESYSNLYIAQSKLMFFESGNFNPQTIDYLPISCGGRFYKTSFLYDNNLYPHDTLYSSEDEYFNRIINYHIELNENKEYEHILNIDYPLYQVFHEEEERVSFAFEDWGGYLCRDHLLSSRYVCEKFFNKNTFEIDHFVKNYFEDIFFNDFIFCWNLLTGLAEEDENLSEDRNRYQEFLPYFKDSLDFYCDAFDSSIESFYHRYKVNPKQVIGLRESAELSLGHSIEKTHSFKDFLSEVEKSETAEE